MPYTPAVTDIRALARAHSRLAMNTLATIARGKGMPPAARVTAAVALLDRGWGRAPTTYAAVGGDDIKVVIRHIVEGRDVGGDVIDVEPVTIVDQTNTDQTR